MSETETTPNVYKSVHLPEKIMSSESLNDKHAWYERAEVNGIIILVAMVLGAIATLWFIL